ncbi:cache domain-containing protein [Paenibacillus sp. 1P03SA]|uniref:cache domain-containing protein n=1 Tax=Paenibacillus sp. 1P03SA TaxID=3132294 RepID=UPI0039A1CD7A
MKKTLSRTIFIYIAVVVIITAASIGWFSYHISSSQLRQQNEQHLIEAVTNAVNHTDLYLKLYERAHLSLFTHPDIRKFLDSPPKDDYAYFQYTDSLKKQVIDPLFLKTPEIMTVYLTDYNKNWVYFVNPALKIIQDPVPGATLEELDKETDSNGNLTIINNSVFSESDTQLITLSRKIHGQVFNEFKGILTIQIKSDEFSTLWKGVNLGRGGFFSIVDHEGRIVHHPDKTRIGQVIGGELLAKLENTQLDFVHGRLFRRRAHDREPEVLVLGLESHGVDSDRRHQQADRQHPVFIVSRRRHYAAYRAAHFVPVRPGHHEADSYSQKRHAADRAGKLDEDSPAAHTQ